MPPLGKKLSIGVEINLLLIERTVVDAEDWDAVRQRR